MKKILKPLGIAVAVIAALGLALALTALWLFDADAYKSELEVLVKRETGRELAIKGDLSLSLFPGLAVELTHTALRNPPGIGGDNLAEFDALELRLKLLPLLRGTVVPELVSVNGLKVRLLRSEDGGSNFADLISAKDSVSEPPPVLLALGAVNLQDALISYQDQASGRTLVLSELDLETGFLSDARPAPLTAQFRFSDSARRLDGTASVDAALSVDKSGMTITAQRLSARVMIEDAGGGLVLRADGRVHYDASARTLGFESMELLAEHAPAAGQSVQALIPRASLDLAAGTASVDEFSLRALALEAGGALSAQNLWTDPKLTGVLRVEDFDPQALWARLGQGGADLPPPDAPAQGSIEFSLTADQNGVVLDPLVLTLNAARISGRIGLGLSPPWPLTTTLLIDVAEKAPRAPIQLTLRGTARAGDKPQVYQVDDFEVALGSVSARARIELDAGGEELAYSATFQLPAFDARALLKTLGEPVPETRDSEALTRIAASAVVTGRGADLTLDPLTIQLDDTQVKGNLSVSDAWRARRAISFDLSADSLDAGRYLPFTMPASGAEAPAAASVGALHSSNINGSLRLGALIVGDLIMDNIEVTARSRDGRLELRSGSAPRTSSLSERIAALPPTATMTP